MRHHRPAFVLLLLLALVSVARGQELDDGGAEISLDEASAADDSNERNDILASISEDAALGPSHPRAPLPPEPPEAPRPHHQRHHPHNEPFYEPGAWSECTGGACGELGKRHRKLHCRIYLSRSSRFADLPESSCQSALAPDTEEPCYLDCQPPEIEPIVDHHNSSLSSASYSLNSSAADATAAAHSSSASQAPASHVDEEIVYDSEMARFVWRSDAWTKCSAECLGGRRENIVECWDKFLETAADASSCEPQQRPDTLVEVCNDVPCPPEWRLEAWSRCNMACGSAGIRTRSIACVQQVPSASAGRGEDAPSGLMVISNDACLQSLNESMPSRIEPCNRVDCRPQWSVGPWSECSRRCGEGFRSRTVSCLQEFASRDGPARDNRTDSGTGAAFSPELAEAIELAARDWHPGKAAQVPFHICYDEYKLVPNLDEKCYNFCDNEPFIDADASQDYQMSASSELAASKKRAITLKVGGKARILEGKNLKIRCRVFNRQHGSNMLRKSPGPVDWFKDGVKIFSNGSTMADKRYAPDDNLILGEDVLSNQDDSKNQVMADEPAHLQPAHQQHQPRPHSQLDHRTWHRQHPSHYQQHHHNQRHILPSQHTPSPRPRFLSVRSWNSNNYHANSYLGSHQQPHDVQENSFSFIPQVGGRFSLVKENTLRIKRLRLDDSGTYTCSYGSLSESLELRVVSRRELIEMDEKLADNVGV